MDAEVPEAFAAWWKYHYNHAPHAQEVYRAAIEASDHAWISRELKSALQSLADEEAETDRLESDASRLAQLLAEEEKENERLGRDLALHEEDADDCSKTHCRLCANPEIEAPWRHDHNGDGKFHWHHCIDPGDGLVSPCKNSDKLEEAFEDLTGENVRYRAALLAVAEAWQARNALRMELSEAWDVKTANVLIKKLDLAKTALDAACAAAAEAVKP